MLDFDNIPCIQLPHFVDTLKSLDQYLDTLGISRVMLPIDILLKQ
jgi:hypothetical protein